MYSLEGVPIKLAETVLSIYCVFVIVSIALFFVVGISFTSWDSIAELTALAINSTRPTALQNTSASIENIDTFRNLILIRAKEGEGLQIVFEDEDVGSDLYRLVEKDKYYCGSSSYYPSCVSSVKVYQISNSPRHSVFECCDVIH
jgi:hypothetical protein